MNLTFHNYLTKLFTLSAFIGVFLLVSQTTLKAQELPTQFEFEHLTQTYEEFDDGNQVPVYQLIQEEYTYPSFDIYPSSEEDFAFSYMGSPVEQYNSIQTMASSIERNHCGAMTIGEFGSPFLEIHPYLARLVDRGYLDAEVLSEISYKIEGETGSQIMKIQWKNWGLPQ